MKMKNLKVSLGLLVLFASLPAMADYDGPWVIKSSGSGFTAPEWSFVETCEVYQDRVVIAHQYGMNTLATREIRKVAMAGDKSLSEIVNLAAEEHLDKSPNYLCDAPVTETHGIQVLPNRGL
jgi:hypothetical protein